MHQLLHQRRRLSLIVCIAIMLNLFTPALGQAMAVLTYDPLAGEICRTSPVGSSGKQIPVAGHDMKHCALCASLAGAPPPAAVVLPAPAVAGTASLAPRDRAPVARARWPDARPRAPPRAA